MKRLASKPSFFFFSFIALMVLLAYLRSDLETKFFHILLVFLAYHAAIIIHEMGHVIFGLMNRLKFVEFTVAFITIDYSTGSLRVKENTDWKKIGGGVIFLPDAADKNELIQKWKWLSIGGPIFSLVFGIIGLLLSWMYPSFFMNIFGYMSLAVAMVTILPLSFGAQKTDGSLFLLLHRNDSESEKFLSHLLLFREFLTNKTPSQWPQELIKSSERIVKQSQHDPISSSRGFRLLLYYYYVDTGQDQEAVKILEPITKLSKTELKDNDEYFGIYSLYITHQSLWGELQSEKVTINENMLKKDPYAFYRTKAAVLIKQKKFIEAQTALKQAKDMYNKWIKPYGFSKVENRFLEEMEKKMAI